MGVEVNDPKHAGVDVTHPRIVEALRNAAKRGMSKDGSLL
jgi:hypothetical protein